MKYKYTRQEVSQWLAENKLINVEEINKVLLSGKGGAISTSEKKSRKGDTANSRPKEIEKMEDNYGGLSSDNRPLWTITATDFKLNQVITAVNYLLKQK